MTDVNLTCAWHLQQTCANARFSVKFCTRSVRIVTESLSSELPIKLFTHEKTSQEINDETP